VPPFRLIPGLTDLPADGLDSGRDVWKNWNDRAAVMIQIESLKGIENLDSILTEVPEIDIVWLGALDCRVSMGLSANLGMGEEKEWVEAVERFRAVCKKHDKPMGGFCFVGGENMVKMARDYSLLVHCADVLKLYEMFGALVEARGVLMKAGIGAN